MPEAVKFPPENLNTLTHFYRGEVQRSTDWRRRLDLTTNWAILATTAAFSWAFTVPKGGSSQLVFVFKSHHLLLLMCIEARRYRYYDVWHTRVRMLEVHLLVPMLNPELKITQGDWRAQLSNDLLLPKFKISFSEALARRLHANYIWLFLGLLGGWLLRVYTEASADGVSPGIKDLYYSCGYEEAVPALVVVFAQVVFWCALAYSYFGSWAARNVTGEIRRRDPNAKQWPI